MIIRPATLKDVDRLLEFSCQIPPGMTSMPNDASTWHKKLSIAENCFAPIDQNAKESKIFFLVLEDEHQQLMGTAGVHTEIGLKRPFYNYKVSKQVMASESLDVTVSCEILNLVNDFTGATELTSLYLSPPARRKPLGQVMSRCRFLLMHDFPEFFGDMVFAEIRGWLNEQETSPFWEHIGKKFFTMPYKKADFISAVNGSQFISDLMPRYPIYLNLMPQEVIDVVGKAHDGAMPAQCLLEKEGFGYRGYVDIFDAGPVVQCEREKIVSINDTEQAIVKQITAYPGEGEALRHCILSNRSKQDYRITASVVKQLDENHIALDADTAQRLDVSEGNTVSLLALREN
ncbi:Arginine N-succinyltransferase subunit beta [Thalassocella blandensis]|nr:Arginine N-succinyltransferase subunit beta [Thalassocella blandensis]